VPASFCASLRLRKKTFVLLPLFVVHKAILSILLSRPKKQLLFLRLFAAIAIKCSSVSKSNPNQTQSEPTLPAPTNVQKAPRSKTTISYILCAIFRWALSLSHLTQPAQPVSLAKKSASKPLNFRSKTLKNRSKAR